MGLIDNTWKNSTWTDNPWDSNPWVDIEALEFTNTGASLDPYIERIRSTVVVGPPLHG